ncbi:MAG: AzlD domain-containing protein [Chloroflexota bacterium]
MSASWAVVIGVGLATIAIKAAGPVLLGGRPLPARLVGVVALLAPALLAALVASLTLAIGTTLTVDARILGVGAALVALLLRVPTLGVVVIAAGITAVARLLGAG